MVFCWTNNGWGTLLFENWDAFLKKAKYKGESDVVGVSMWIIDGNLFYTRG